MRTPLNSACMGLELLQDTSPSNESRESTLCIVDDVVESCDTAVNILNELLIFEKLESSTLELNLKQFSPQSYLTGVLEPFRVPVNETGLVAGNVWGGERWYTTKLLSENNHIFHSYVQLKFDLAP